MKKQYHILNGDALKQQFPKNIHGEIIVARECLVDGPINGNNLEELFKTRAKFISDNYHGYIEQDYYQKTVPEFNKIKDITNPAEINLWFEDDLFCQVNFWFTVNLLINSKKKNSIFLIRPITHTRYGFGGLNKTELVSVFENRIELTQLDKIALLWEFYQKNNTDKLLLVAQELESNYSFILPAVKAHLERIPTDGNLGRPSQSLIDIMKDLNTQKFEPVFKEFCIRESIYGYGDLQVKRLLDEIKNNH